MEIVSVIMGVYKPDPQQLERAVRSIETQTYQDWELIICDDGSEDETWTTLKALAKRNERVFITRHEKNRGLAAALNTCLELAQGTYIARQDADDQSVPQRLELQVGFLESMPGAACVGSAIQLFDGQRIWATKVFPEAPEKSDFLFAIPFLHGSMMFRADALRACGGYRSTRRTRRTEDYELMMRMYAGGYRAWNLKEPLYCYREDSKTLLKRKFRYRFDEAVIRAQGFYRLRLYPVALPYVVKPLIVGLIPQGVLAKWKMAYYHLK